jgi:hypothetical protein
MKTKQTNKANLNNSKIAKNLLGIFLLSTLLMTSCKDPVEPNEDPKPDGIALSERFENNRLDAIQKFTVDMDGGAVVIGAQGTQVTFPTNSLGIAGVPVTGNITVELIEVYSKGAMLLQNMPTSGKKSNGDEEALKSAGEFFVNAKQGSTQLEVIVPFEIQSHLVDPTEWEAMQIFRAGDDVQDNDLWVAADEDENGIDDEAKGREAQGADGDYVMVSYFDVSNFGWTNLDRWYGYTGALTDIFVDVPDDFDGDNCEVFLSYDGEPTALARMDIYNSTTALFTEHYGRIPVGQEVHIILVTEITGQLHYTIQGTTIADNHTEVMANPQPITQVDLEALINALP